MSSSNLECVMGQSGVTGGFSDALCKIFVTGLRVNVRVGVFPHEEFGPQPLVIDAELKYINALPTTDDYIDYDAYCTALVEFLTAKGHTKLLETLAVDMAVWSFRKFEVLEAIHLSIHKPKLRKDVERLGITFAWTRSFFEQGGNWRRLITDDAHNSDR